VSRRVRRLDRAGRAEGDGPEAAAFHRQAASIALVQIGVIPTNIP
jgi:hypothetical protein